MRPARRHSHPDIDPSSRWRDLCGRVAQLNLEAVETTLPAKAEETLRQWFSRRTVSTDDAEAMKAATLAMTLAVELESFTPSHSGATAVDRLARRRTLGAEERVALQALREARFAAFIVRKPIGDDLFSASDFATQRDFVLFDDGLPAAAIGIPLAARLFALDGETWGAVGMVIPLDPAGLAVAQDFVRPGRGIPHGHRCAAAVYRHVVRHGGPVIPGLNDIPAEDLQDRDEDGIEPSPFDVLVSGLVESDAWRSPPKTVLDEVRRLASVDGILHCLYRAASATRVDAVDPRMAFRRFAEVMIEALHLRALAGSGAQRAPLEALAAIVDREAATNGYPRAAADLFREIRRALDAAKPRPGGEDLTRVIDRIRGLRAKTVDQGCTEEEALAAADKVAELLDRYGLSLGETDLRQQTCLGVGIGSSRKRFGALDDCLPRIAHFCDCRSWFERAADGTIRSMVFGLPADVEAAQYLYERVATALDTETAQFHRGDLYRSLVGGGRQKATHSFQLGLGRGISEKLETRKAERDTKTFQLTGRDLVPVKASVVDEELARLGMAFQSKDSFRGRSVMRGAYEAGRVAGDQFEIQSEIE